MARKPRGTALFRLFFGVFGFRRLYVGKTGSGVVQLLLATSLAGAIITVVWGMVDFTVIICGAFTDGTGKRITNRRAD